MRWIARLWQVAVCFHLFWIWRSTATSWVSGTGRIPAQILYESVSYYFTFWTFIVSWCLPFKGVNTGWYFVSQRSLIHTLIEMGRRNVIHLSLASYTRWEVEFLGYYENKISEIEIMVGLIVLCGNDLSSRNLYIWLSPNTNMKVNRNKLALFLHFCVPEDITILKLPVVAFFNMIQFFKLGK